MYIEFCEVQHNNCKVGQKNKYMMEGKGGRVIFTGSTSL